MAAPTAEVNAETIDWAFRRNVRSAFLLADAGLRVLAAYGARGLTHRAVDKEASVPIGTASNYFSSRDEMLGALAERIRVRLAPDPGRLEEFSEREPSVDLSVDYIRYIVERTTEAPELTLALMELRLEASRRPSLAKILGDTLWRSYREDVNFNLSAELPGGAFEIALLHYAIDGLLLDQLTTTIDPDIPIERVVEELVKRLLV